MLQRHPSPSPRATLCQKKAALPKVMTALIYYLVAPDSPFNIYSYNDGHNSLSISPLWQTRWYVFSLEVAVVTLQKGKFSTDSCCCATGPRCEYEDLRCYSTPPRGEEHVVSWQPHSSGSACWSFSPALLTVRSNGPSLSLARMLTLSSAHPLHPPPYDACLIDQWLLTQLCLEKAANVHAIQWASSLPSSSEICMLVLG